MKRSTGRTRGSSVKKTAGRAQGASARPATARTATRREPAIRLPRDPKGRRAQFFDDPAVDQLYAIAVALTAEVSVAFERLDTLERLLAQHGVLAAGSLDAWLPDEDEAAERARRREELIQRVFQVLSQYGPPPA